LLTAGRSLWGPVRAGEVFEHVQFAISEFLLFDM
jgi:hypothetical protein